ncbi:MAG: hypothetical protein H5T78_07690 [Nocardia sp.]|nr:hypothetical protein [Nocardia sp.]
MGAMGAMSTSLSGTVAEGVHRLGAMSTSLSGTVAEGVHRLGAMSTSRSGTVAEHRWGGTAAVSGQYGG